MCLNTDEGCVTPIFKSCASISADIKTTLEIITKIPFPPKTTKNFVIILTKTVINYKVIMGKRKPKNNFVKSTPKAATDVETSEGEENLHRDLQQGCLGAAFIHPQRRIWAPETPIQQNPTVSTSADATSVVTESFDATAVLTESFDEQENDTPQPSTSNAVRIFAGTIPIPNYYNAYGCYTNRGWSPKFETTKLQFYDHF